VEVSGWKSLPNELLSLVLGDWAYILASGLHNLIAIVMIACTVKQANYPICASITQQSGE
jgi:hypothetical protein